MEKKIVYGFRKSRLSKGLCGAVLGAALLLAAGSVQAEEKAAEAKDQSASSETVQPTAAPVQSEPVSQDKLPLEVSHADLDQAVAEAEKAGIQLKQESPVDLDYEIGRASCRERV